MPKMTIDKSILINKSPEDIYPKLNDFNHWTPWSPWLIMEKGVAVNVADDAKYYEWQGDLVGSGNMKITKEIENTSIAYDLNFLKPWKSFAKVGFKLVPEGEGTRVHWTMESKLPFFMFFMKKMMTAFVGMDYERGLRMLKNYVEDGTVHSKLDFKGKSTFEGGAYIGVKTACTMDEMGNKMKSDFEKIWEQVDHSVAVGPAFTIYHKWDAVNRQVTYTSAIPVASVPSDLGGLISGTIPKTTVHSVVHTGPYEHIGNAWAAQYSMQRAKKFKVNKTIMPFEVYLNDPREVAPTDLESVVHFPTK